MIPVLSRPTARRRPAASAFSPADVTGLQLWLAADAIAGLSDGDPVGTWADASGGGRDATAAGSERPAYQTAVLDGLPVVRFDGSDDVLRLPLGSLAALTAGTLLAVVRDAAAGNIGLHNLGSGSAGWFPFGGAIYDNFGSTTRHDGISTGAASLQDWHVYAARSAAGAWACWLDGTQLYATATNTVGFPDAIHDATVGANGIGGYLNGDLAELLIYAAAISDADRQAVEAYLQQKYSL